MEHAPLEITEVRIKLTGDPRSKLKAYCSVTFADQFVVRDLKIIEGGQGDFVAMPSRKLADRCSHCAHKNHLRAAFCNQCGGRLDPRRSDRLARSEGGRQRVHADLAHPINRETRNRMQAAILAAYRDELERSQQEGYQPQGFDDLDFDDFSADEWIEERASRARDVERTGGGGEVRDAGERDAAEGF